MTETCPSVTIDHPRSPITIRDTFSSLKYPNYRLWFIGQLVSLVGTWMQTTAQGFLMYELTRSPAYLGYAGFAAGVPAWLFTLYGGLVADRMPRRTLLVLTQLWMMTLAVVMAVLTFSGLVQPWHIILMAFLLGIGNAFDAPARQSFVLEMVSRENLTNAIALNSTMFNAATAVGPMVAGFTYALVGPAWCFTINAISFIAVILALMLMRLAPHQPVVQRDPAWQAIREGLSFVLSARVVRTLVLNMCALSLFGFSFVTLMPAWAVNILGGDATTNGMLQAARGVGAFAGALMMAMLSRAGMRGKTAVYGGLLFPIFLVTFAFIRWLPLTLLLLVCLGWAMMSFMNNSNSLIQTQVPDELRGRVMSIFTLTFFGLMPVGALLAGQAAVIFGEPLTLIIGGSLLFICTAFLWSRAPELRTLK